MGIERELLAKALLESHIDLDILRPLLMLRIHGVEAEWIRELKEMGYHDLTSEDLLAIRIHGMDRILRKQRRAR